MEEEGPTRGTQHERGTMDGPISTRESVGPLPGPTIPEVRDLALEVTQRVPAVPGGDRSRRTDRKEDRAEKTGRPRNRPSTEDSAAYRLHIRGGGPRHPSPSGQDPSSTAAEVEAQTRPAADETDDSAPAARGEPADEKGPRPNGGSSTPGGPGSAHEGPAGENAQAPGAPEEKQRAAASRDPRQGPGGPPGKENPEPSPGPPGPEATTGRDQPFGPDRGEEARTGMEAPQPDRPVSENPRGKELDEALQEAKERWREVNEQEKEEGEEGPGGARDVPALTREEDPGEPEASKGAPGPDRGPSIQSIPDPSRYGLPLDEETTVYTPRFSPPSQTGLTSRAMDPTSPLETTPPDVSVSSARQRRLALRYEAFAAATSEPEPRRPVLDVVV